MKGLAREPVCTTQRHWQQRAVGWGQGRGEQREGKGDIYNNVNNKNKVKLLKNKVGKMNIISHDRQSCHKE